MVWRRKTEITNEEVIKVANELNINELMARILLNRGMDIDNINTIVNEPYNAFIEPSEFTNAEKAAKRIAEYCKNENAIIWIFGDYDVDGFTSVYTMASALSEVAKCEVRYYFPERSEGYGLSLDFCKAFIEEDIDNDNKLVITVDNGISCLKEIEYLQNNGIEVIVTDHHVAKDNVPNCLIVDAHNHNEPETFKHLAGCGVAFKVAQLVQREFNVYNMAKYTFATAIGTIADAVPMSIENIAFIKYGLDIINSDECPKGIKALKRFLGKDVITSSDIAWDIAPRLNACSRMGDVYLGSKVFFTDDVENIDDLVVEIDEINTHRKNATKNIEKYIDKLNVKPTDTVCCVDLTSTDCPEGLVGIAATKITEKFKRPAFVFCKKEDKLLGSARSVDGVNLQEILKNETLSDYIVEYGGHEQAAGISIKQEAFDDFKTEVASQVTIDIQDEEVTDEELIIDEIISLEHINGATYDLINEIPYDNRTFPTPVFALADIKVVNTSFSKKNPNNICFEFMEGRVKKSMWAWGFADKYKSIGSPKTVHVAGIVDRDFMKPNCFTLKIMDIIPA